MVTTTSKAETHEPIGDSEHVAYGKDYVWSCSCGKTGNFITTKARATSRAKGHEDYCDGEPTVDLV